MLRMKSRARLAFADYLRVPLLCHFLIYIFLVLRVWNYGRLRCSEISLRNRISVDRSGYERTHTSAKRTPLRFTNANEVGRNILRVRPRGCGRGSRMLRCYGDHVQGRSYTCCAMVWVGRRSVLVCVQTGMKRPWELLSRCCCLFIRNKVTLKS